MYLSRSSWNVRVPESFAGRMVCGHAACPGPAGSSGRGRAAGSRPAGRPSGASGVLRLHLLVGCWSVPSGPAQACQQERSHPAAAGLIP